MMRDFLAVFSYTFRENVRKRVFLISTVIVLLLTVLVMLLPTIIGAVAARSGEPGGQGGQGAAAQERRVFVVDRENIFGGDLSVLSAEFAGVAFELKAAGDVPALRERIKDDDKLSLLDISLADGAPVSRYAVSKIGAGPDPDALNAAVKRAYGAGLLARAGVPGDVADRVLRPAVISTEELGTGMLSSAIISVIITILLYFAIYLYGYGVAMSVASEKTSRVMELLITSTKPSRIVLGKAAAMGVLGLLQLLLTLLVGAATYALAFPKDLQVAGMNIDLSGFTPGALLLLVVYFVLGYALYAMLNAVAGATVTKAEDVNAAVMPVSMLSLLAFFLSYYPSLFPGGERIMAVMSLVPFTAPFAMPGMLLSGAVPPWQVAASLLLLCGTIALFSWFSIRMYSSAVLHYGNRLKLGDLVGLARRG